LILIRFLDYINNLLTYLLTFKYDCSYSYYYYVTITLIYDDGFDDW